MRNGNNISFAVPQPLKTEEVPQPKARRSYTTPMGSLSDAQKVLLKLASRDIRRNPGVLSFPDLVRLQQELTNEIERRRSKDIKPSQGKDEA